jgi:hypothetical protein
VPVPPQPYAMRLRPLDRSRASPNGRTCDSGRSRGDSTSAAVAPRSVDAAAFSAIPGRRRGHGRRGTLVVRDRGARARWARRPLDWGRAWRDDHRYLLNVAVRVLGSISEAKDAVREASARLVDQNLDEIDDVRRRLAVVVSRLCFDRLRSADRQWRTPLPCTTLELPPSSRDPAAGTASLHRR